MAPSSSGPGHQVLILKIAGSNPAGVTIYFKSFTAYNLSNIMGCEMAERDKDYQGLVG